MELEYLHKCEWQKLGRCQLREYDFENVIGFSLFLLFSFDEKQWNICTNVKDSVNGERFF